MIPKVIHYCWFGRNPLPELARKCIASWRKFLPDYEIKEWNEDNFDVNQMKFTQEAYALGKYAFVSDVARVLALNEIGGIYLDTDVEILSSFDDFLGKSSVFGYEMNGKQIATAVILTEPHQKWLQQLLNYYRSHPFIRFWGKLNSTPNPVLFGNVLKSNKVAYDDKMKELGDSMVIYPTSCFCAKDYATGQLEVTEHTVAIHHYQESWVIKDDSVVKKMRRLIKNLSIKYCK